MSLTALRRTAAGAAVLATAVPASPPCRRCTRPPTPAWPPTSITIRAVHGAVRPGGTDTITGALIVAGSGSAAGRTVTLEARPMGADDFVPVGDAIAADRGGLRESVTPDVTTRYRWHYAGDTDARPSYSGVVQRPGPDAAPPRQPDQHLALDPRRAPRRAASTVRTWCGAGSAPGTSRSGTVR